MALPPRPQSTNTTTAPVAAVAAAPVTENADGKIAPKRFAAAKDDAGNPVPVPAVAGADMLVIGNALWEAVKTAVANAGLDLETVVNACAETTKEVFPGHKSGRIAYATCDVLAQLGKNHALLTKTRSGVAPMTALKAKLEEKDKKLAALEAQIAQLMAAMGGAK